MVALPYLSFAHNGLKSILHRYGQCTWFDIERVKNITPVFILYRFVCCHYHVSFSFFSFFFSLLIFDLPMKRNAATFILVFLDRLTDGSQLKSHVLLFFRYNKLISHTFVMHNKIEIDFTQNTIVTCIIFV